MVRIDPSAFGCLSGLVVTTVLFVPSAWSQPVGIGRSPGGEQLYTYLHALAQNEGADSTIFERLAVAARGVDWATGKREVFAGHLRVLETPAAEGTRDFYLVRPPTGEIFVLALPEDEAELAAGTDSPYAALSEHLKYKTEFSVTVAAKVIDGVSYQFARLEMPPARSTLDRLFFALIVVFLFLIMVGMGMTLTPADFALFFEKPAGVIVGVMCQFGLLPLIAMVMGRGAGFYETYPFVFLGLILISASPGGVTSNLYTYLGKGDVALSVTLTAVCTVLSLLFTPLLIAAYVGSILDTSVIVTEIIKSLLVLVVVPVFIGLYVRKKAPIFAQRTVKPFAVFGVFTLLLIILVGVWGNFEQFADTARYGVKFYAVVFLLTFGGMFFGALVAKAARISNFQTRAIALEVGIRNGALAMTIALLLQDRVGDFAGSMFFTSAIFGLLMYFAAGLVAFSFKYVLPVAVATPSASYEKNDGVLS